MYFFDILQLVDFLVVPAQCKVHFASWDGHDEPLDLFYAGKFEQWQTKQSKRNFERTFIVSLISLPEKHCWLFVGVYRVLGCTRKNKKMLVYRTEFLEEYSSLSGRLIVEYVKSERQSYRNAEKLCKSITVLEIKRDDREIFSFPGFNNVCVSHQRLKSLVKLQVHSWYSALSNVKGIYAIVDTKTGKVYIGSATGQEMIWARWSCYATSGHGGNKILMDILYHNEDGYANNFQYSLLEVFDVKVHDHEILKREEHWKNIFRTREFGYNAN